MTEDKEWIHEKCGTNTPPKSAPKHRSTGNKSMKHTVKLTDAMLKALYAFKTLDNTIKALVEQYDDYAEIDDLVTAQEDIATSVCSFIVRELNIDGTVDQNRIEEERAYQEENW